jgi:uncharacterized protein
VPSLQKFDDDLKTALKAGDVLRVSVLRMVKAGLKNRQIEKGGELSEEEVLSVLSSMAKQRKESIEQFSKGGREDLAEKERTELSIIQSYLPAQLSVEEIDAVIAEAIRESSAMGSKDVGKVMKLVMPRLKGGADGKTVNQRVIKHLEQR